ncbi:MAG TPA: (d)CMP kinase [Candidatus Limnocylindria bacterium]|nr:(d)CMP kinase [Candidatus Limnocylindria bacterium]
MRRASRSMPPERIQKLLARSGVASRRGAEQLIAAGRVTVNGRVATLGQTADQATDRVELDGAPLGEATANIHLAVHKPVGVLSSARDERGRRSVVSLVDVPRGTRLWPAGRLDVDSEGLMLLTNDGAWANRVLHPRYGVEREYAALVDPNPTSDDREALLAGVELDDGPARLLAIHDAPPPPEVARAAGERGRWLRIRVGEGRKREVRRLFAAGGYHVERLVRTRLGSLALAGLGAGEWRPLRAAEVEALAGTRPRVAPQRERRPILTVAIDGPSGSGKSTIGYALAQRIGATFVDTGLMYRALTVAALERGLDAEDGDALGRLARQVRITVRRPRRVQADRRETVLLDGRDVTDEARTPRVDRAVPSVARHASVRGAMLATQRAAARRRDTVMVGRDIGTVVLPDANLKVFLTASAGVRARRRAAEMGRPDRGERYRREIEERDAADTGRTVAPLRKAPGALVVDTGELDVEAAVDAIVAHLPAPG